MNPERICYGCFKEKEPGYYCPNCGFNETEEQPYLALPLGTILNGRYLTGKVLGVGGFGITYLGYDLTLEIKVAIKEYMPSALATRHADHYSVVLTGHTESEYKNGMERFLDEARILAKLQNTPNIVSVQNYFKENNTAYFVMEYVEGMSLKEYLASQGGRIPFAQAMTILEPIMEALEQVHALSLLHRDISPDNIYITSKSESRLLDFGAARFASGDGKSVSVILKHGYAPEEQYSSHGNQGPWTDVYAMGATLYRCITGIVPPDSIERVRQDTLKRPSELGVSMPAEAENALMKALSLNTQDRFSDMARFISALTGRTAVQDSITAGIDRRMQGASAGQTVCVGTSVKSEKPSVFARLFAYLKANPVIAWILGGGLTAVIALCIILPIALGGGKAPAADSPLPSATPDAPQLTQPQTPAPDTPENAPVEYDLGVYNAVMTIPSNYVKQENSYSFVDSENERLVALIDYAWQLGGPIYSLADVRSSCEAIVDQLMTQLNVEGDHSIITAGEDSIGGRDAYQIYISAAESGTSLNFIVEAVEGDNDCGCYFLIGCFNAEDEQGLTEVYGAISSFRCTGAIDVSYGVISDEEAGVKVICDKSMVKSTEIKGFTLPNGNKGTAMLLYFTSDADLYVEVEEGTAAGSDADECLSYLTGIWKSVSEAKVGKKQEEVIGGVTWKYREISYGSFSITSAAADIDGVPYIVGMTTDDANRETAATLLADVLASVRPIS